MLGCPIVAPLLLFGAYAGFRIADAQLRDVQEGLSIEARTLSAKVDGEIIGEIERLQALAASSSLRQGDFADFQHQAEASLALRGSGNIVLIDRNMQLLVHTAVPFGKPLPGSAVLKLVERVFATGQPQVSDLFISPITKKLLVPIIVPVEIEGERRYALARAPEPRTFARLVAAKELPAGWHAMVSNVTHHIIAQSGNQYAFGQELPPMQWARDGSGGVFEFIDSEARPSLQASARSELTGWETARVGAQGSARGAGSGDVVDDRPDGIAGNCAGGCLGLMAGPDYRAFGRPRGGSRSTSSPPTPANTGRCRRTWAVSMSAGGSTAISSP